MMEFEQEEVLAPASPGAQYLNSSALSLTVMAIMETEVPIDESLVIPHFKNVLFPLNTRFSSIMVSGKDGSRKWKPVKVKFEDHIIIPNIPKQKSLELYDDYITEYISKLATIKLPQNRPLWEIHIIKCPSSNGAGTIIFKLHHSLGDGYTLMGVVLSGLQRVDNPMLPLTFPSRDQSKMKSDNNSSSNGFLKMAPTYFKRFMFTLSDFGWGILKSKLIEDDRSPIRSGGDRVEFRPPVVTTMKFPLDSIKQIKDKLKVTINDVITGIVMMGTRLYMEEENPESRHANCNALVLLNTRAVGGYKSVNEMIKPNTNMPWGNHFAFLHIPVPQLTTSDCSSNPLNFILKAHKMIKNKRNSAAVYLTGMMLDALRRVKGPESTAEYIHSTLKNSSLTISNVIGPVDQMALAGHPIKGLYFFVAGAPQSLAILVISYMGYLRVAVAVEKDFIDPKKLKSCIQKSFHTILEDALSSTLSKESQCN